VEEMNEPTIDEQIAYQREPWGSGEHEAAILASLKELAAIKSQQTEPVAWCNEKYNALFFDQPGIRESAAYENGELTPLYTAPQSGVREGMLRDDLREDKAYLRGLREGYNSGTDQARAIAKQTAYAEAITRAADQVNTDTVSVPREPTKQMLDAGGNAHWEADKNGNMLRTEAAHRIYNAMLRAAQEGKK
jgi:hypothetical protein